MTERLPAFSPAGPRDAIAAIAAGRRSHMNPQGPSPETQRENSGHGRRLSPWERRPRRDAAVAGRDDTDCRGAR